MTKSKNIDNSDNSQDKTSKQADEPIPTPPPTGSHSQRRRRLLKQLAAGGGVIATGNALPTEWKRPVIQSVLLPAHAQISPTPSPTPTSTECGCCEGHVASLTLQYNGNDPIVATFEAKGNALAEDVPLEKGDEVGPLDFDDPPGDLKITVDEEEVVEPIHLSCSADVGIGATFGDFEVIAGSSNDGGPLPPTGDCWDSCVENGEPGEGCCD